VGQVLGLDADAGVGDADHDPLVAGSAALHAGLDGEHSAVSHGVARIDDQAEKRLLELAGVGMDLAVAGAVEALDANVGIVDLAARHGEGVVDRGLNPHRLWMGSLRAGVAHQAIADLRPALGGTQDGVAKLQVAVGVVRGGQLGPAAHDGQEVVELMGEAGGELPHRGEAV